MKTLRPLAQTMWPLAALALPTALAQAPPISLVDIVTQDRGLNCAGPIISYRNNIFVAGLDTDYTDPRRGMIACYDEDLNLVDTLTLLGTGFSAAVAHEGIGYFTLSSGTPGKVVKVDLNTFEFIGQPLSLSFEEGPWTMVVHNGIIYAGNDNQPAAIARIDIKTFTELPDPIQLPTGFNKFFMQASISYDGFVYMSTNGNSINIPSQLIKIDPVAWTYESLALPAFNCWGLTAYEGQILASCPNYSTGDSMIIRVDAKTLTVNNQATIPDCQTFNMNTWDGYAYINCDQYSPPLRMITYDLKTFTQMTPDLTSTDFSRVWQETYVAILNNKWLYSGVCGDPIQPAPLFKYGPVLSRCDTAGVTLTGKPSRRTVVAPPATPYNKPVNKPARGPLIKYMVTLANTNKGSWAYMFLLE